MLRRNLRVEGNYISNFTYSAKNDYIHLNCLIILPYDYHFIHIMQQFIPTFIKNIFCQHDSSNFQKKFLLVFARATFEQFLHNFENLCVRSVSKVRIMRNIQASLQNHQGVINFSKAYYTYLNIRTFVYTNSLIILCSPNVRRNACLRCYIFPCHKI